MLWPMHPTPAFSLGPPPCQEGSGTVPGQQRKYLPKHPIRDQSAAASAAPRALRLIGGAAGATVKALQPPRLAGGAAVATRKRGPAGPFLLIYTEWHTPRDRPGEAAPALPARSRPGGGWGSNPRPADYESAALTG